jgi:tRNA(fMet)-specific endonuclease VapC
VIVADTDVLIDALRGREPAARRVAVEIEAGRLATTVISAFELLSGARQPGERQRIEDLLAGMAVVPLDARSGAVAAELRRELEGRGESIGLADYLIAGICVGRSVSLMTRNRRHFDRIPGLRLAEPEPLGLPSPPAAP